MTAGAFFFPIRGFSINGLCSASINFTRVDGAIKDMVYRLDYILQTKWMSRDNLRVKHTCVEEKLKNIHIYKGAWALRVVAVRRSTSL